MPVEIDHENQSAGCPTPGGLRHARGTPRQLGHRPLPADSDARRKPRRTCCCSHTDETCRLLGSARITTWSHGCRSPNNGRATCRNRRATRWRSTAVPTDLAMINPTRGPLQSCDWLPRRTWTTTSGCTVRIPYLTVASNSVDRLMRLRADSTAKKPAVTIRQSVRDGLYGAGRTRWLARPEYASSAENHERGLGAGCSAGRSACPWPRRSPRCVSHTIRPLISHSRRPEVVWLLAGAVPGGIIQVAAVSPTFGRLFEGTDEASPGQTSPVPTDSGRTAPPRKMAASNALRIARTSKDRQRKTKELLAAAPKTVSFGQCCFGLKRRPTMKRGWRID